MKATSIVLVMSASLLLIPVVAMAQNSSTNSSAPNSQTNSSAPNSQTNNSNPISPGVREFKVDNPLGVSSVCGLIKALLQAAIAIGIPIAVLFIVYAGFKFVLAQGSPDKLKEARSNFLWTIVGIGIFLAAWLLASVIANTVNALQAGSGNSSIISCR